MSSAVGKKVAVYCLLVAFFTSGSVARGKTYYVQPGDSLYSIAARHGTSIAALMRNNDLQTTAIYPGQALRLTRPNWSTSNDGTYEKTYLVGYGEPLSLIARRHGISLESLLKANNLNHATPVLPGQRLIIPKESSGGGGEGKYHLSQSDYDLLARLVSAEAAGEPFEGQVAVAASILNRLEDPRYPDTIYEIIYQVDNGKYQYSPVLDGRIELPATPSVYQAVDQALAGADPSNGANGFYNPAKTSNQWIKSQPVTAVIGNHVFYRY